MPSLEEIKTRLARVEQSHLLNFYTSLAPSQQRALLDQIASLDLESLPALIREYVHRKPVFSLPPGVEPAPYFPFDPARAGHGTAMPYDRAAAKRAGEDLIRAGKVAAFVVAGGQGSRLGFEGPKGCFPAGAITRKSLFQFFAENLLAAKDRFGVDVPWYIMTSPLNHAASVAFFEANKFFGLPRASVMFFPQGVLPSLDITTGRVLLAGKGEVATNPDGHGGAMKALVVSGALADMKKRGVEHISYFQVDNPCVRILDPVFLGLHAAARESSGEMSSKMVPKVNAEEKVGVFCKVPRKSASGGGAGVEVIEYSDLPMELQRERAKDGSLRFLAGSIAIHAISVEFVERVASDPNFQLPYHRAEKKIPCVDPTTGEAITPASNNGVKLERFVFDALAFAGMDPTRAGDRRGSILYETDRVEEFAPIKNASGSDSVESSKALQTLRAARWLERAGVEIPTREGTPSLVSAGGEPDCVIELSPRTAMSAEELNDAMARGKISRTIERGAKIAM